MKQTNMLNFDDGLEKMKKRECMAIFYDEPLAEFQQNLGCEFVIYSTKHDNFVFLYSFKQWRPISNSQ